MEKIQKTAAALAAAAVALVAAPSAAFAQSEEAASEEKESLWSFSAGADLVSSYMWRGQEICGASFQPSLGVACGPVSLSAWGSTNFDGDNKEVDLVLAFEKGGFSAMFTDYFFPGNGKFFTYEKGETCHQLELGVAYDFSANTKLPLSVGVYTMLAGDDLDANGDYNHSTYLELAYGFSVKDVDVEVATGFASGESVYQDNESFNMVNLSVKGSYEIEFNEKFSLPVFAQLVLNPNKEDINLVFGFSF